MILIDQLSDRTVESWEFIDEFIEQTQYKARLIQLLAMRWPICGMILSRYIHNI